VRPAETLMLRTIPRPLTNSEQRLREGNAQTLYSDRIIQIVSPGIQF